MVNDDDDDDDDEDDDDDDDGGIHPGHHHYHHVGVKIQAKVSVQVYLMMAKNRQRDEVHFCFSTNHVQFEFEGVSSQRPAVVRRSSLLLPFCC